MDSSKVNFEELLQVSVEPGKKDHLEEDTIFGAEEDADEK